MSNSTVKTQIAEPCGYRGELGNNSFSGLGLFDGILALSPLSVIDEKVQYEMICAPSEDSDQPGHLSSLIRVFAVCSMLLRA